MKFNIVSLIILLISLVGCSKQAQDKVVEEDNIYNLADGDTIYSSNRFFIQDIDVKNNHVLLQTVGEQVAFALLKDNLSDIELIIYTGEGPDDIVSGRLMKTCADNSDTQFVIYDNSLGKIIKIPTTPQLSINSVVDHSIIENRSLCFNDTLMIGHKMGSPEQLFISTGNQNNVFCDYYLSMPEDVENKIGDKYEYLMSNCFAVNPAKDRLLSFSYFFDCVAAYSLDGQFISSNRDSNDISDEFKEIIDNGNYLSYCHPYASEEACYIKVIQYVNNMIDKQYIQKLNYDGQLLKTYRLPENASGGYAINNDSELYCIVSEIKGDDEIYHIVKYQLD